MRPLNSLDMFMIGTYSESMITGNNAYVGDFIGIAHELLYINPNYNFDEDIIDVRSWAEFYKCYDKDTESIILDNKIIERVKSYQSIAKKINNNIYADFIEASKNYHNKKNISLKLMH